MSPRRAALEPETEKNNFAGDMALEGPAVSFEIGTDADSEKEKESDKDKDNERFQTPEPGRKKLTAAKAAAAALEKDKEQKSLARSSGDRGLSLGHRSEEFGQQVERPREQEATGEFDERTNEERRERREFEGRERASRTETIEDKAGRE